MFVSGIFYAYKFGKSTADFFIKLHASTYVVCIKILLEKIVYFYRIGVITLIPVLE
jgi:hypothetical protein